MFSSCVGRKQPSLPSSKASSLPGVSGRKQRQIDQSISKRMKATKKEYTHTYRLLLLGSGESGKSTIVKQMQILHKEGFTDEERRRRIADIQKNILDSILSITRAMSKINPPIPMPDTITLRVEQIWERAESLFGFEFTEDFYDSVRLIWNNGAIQSAFLRANEYQLIDCAQYFLDRLDEIRRPGYLPTDQDILRCRSQTTGIQQVKFVVEKVHFHLFDVGGQRYERRRWCQCFHGITAILFVTAMSDFNLMLAEDQKENRLAESVKLFGEVWRNRFLQGVSVILFLNKLDLLSSKLLQGKARLDIFFPEFTQYQRTSRSSQASASLASGASASKLPVQNDLANRRTNSVSDESLEVTMAKHFIRDMFVREKNASLAHQEGPRNITRQFYAHYTCAVDTENIRRIFDDVKNTIQIINLKNYELI